MARRLVMTVGTSLFHSASWECEGLLTDISGYERWCEENEYLASPLKRRTMCERGGTVTGSSVTDQLKELLRKKKSDPGELPFIAEVDASTEPRRYSAELTTLLVHWRQEPSGNINFKNFTNEQYSRISLIAPESEDDPAAIAARHLRDYLTQITGFEERKVDVVTLESDKPFEDYKEKLTAWGDNDGEPPLDLIVSGGYKAYATITGRFLESNHSWRSLYLHQNMVEVWKEKWDRRLNQVVTERLSIGAADPI